MKNTLYLGFLSMLMVSAVNAETLTPVQAADDAEQAAKITKEKVFEVRMLANAAAVPGIDEATKEAIEKKAGEAIVTAAMGVQTAHAMQQVAQKAGDSLQADKAKQALDDAKEHYAKIPETARSFSGFFKSVLNNVGPIVTAVAPIAIQAGQTAAQAGFAGFSAYQQQKNQQKQPIKTKYNK